MNSLLYEPDETAPTLDKWLKDDGIDYKLFKKKKEHNSKRNNNERHNEYNPQRI